MPVYTYFSQKLPRDLEGRISYVSGMGFEPLYTVNQVHGDTVVYVGEDYAYQDADALISDKSEIFLAVKTADCVPILLWDNTLKVCGAVHSGWKGTSLRIAVRAVEAMVQRFGSAPDNISAAIGPCICGDCYEVSQEVVDAIGTDCDGFVNYDTPKPHVDLAKIVKHQLTQAGLTNISISKECTRCNSDTYWSHRAHGSERGLQLSIVGFSEKKLICC